MAVNEQGQAIATAADYAILAETDAGRRILADLRTQFESHLPSYREDELLADPAAADTFAKLRDGNREVLQYLDVRISQRDNPNLTT